MANMIDDLLLSHVVYDWTDPLIFPSISKRPLGQAKDFLWHHRPYKPSFVYSNKVPLKHVRTQHAQIDITDIMSLLDHTIQVGLIFLKSSVLRFSSTIFFPSTTLSPSLLFKSLPLPIPICNMSLLPFSWRWTFRSHEKLSMLGSLLCKYLKIPLLWSIGQMSLDAVFQNQNHWKDQTHSH